MLAKKSIKSFNQLIQSSKNQIKHYPIIIFGGGIVGMSLAIRLAQLGIGSALIVQQNWNHSKHNTTNQLSLSNLSNPLGSQLDPSELKVSALSKNSIEFLRSLGLGQTINQFAHFYQKMQVVDWQKNLNLQFQADDFNSNLLVKDANNRNCLGAVIANCLIERALKSLIVQMSVHLHNRWANRSARDLLGTSQMGRQTACSKDRLESPVIEDKYGCWARRGVGTFR